MASCGGASFVLRVFACCLLFSVSSAGSCSHLNNCNGYGACDTVNSRCLCYNGFGSDTDISIYKAPDCSARASASALLLSRWRTRRAPNAHARNENNPPPPPHSTTGTCPSDRAWVDVPTFSASGSVAHAPAECSNAGLCDRTTGRCRCFAGYEGEACQRSASSTWHHSPRVFPLLTPSPAAISFPPILASRLPWRARLQWLRKVPLSEVDGSGT